MHQSTLVLPSIRNRQLRDTFEEIVPHQISLGPTVVLQNFNMVISTQELGEIATPYAALIVQENSGGDQ
jgi:hypothetical protein